MNFASTNCPSKEELRGKGIKSRSKLLSPKYLSQSSLAEQSKNPSSPIRVHFVNSIIFMQRRRVQDEDGEKSTQMTEGHKTTRHSKFDGRKIQKEEQRRSHVIFDKKKLGSS
ncbi:hypothetical protein Tco_0143798 [Tanacetum coccineum]